MPSNGNTRVYELLSAIPAGAGPYNFDVDLPAGAYMISALVRSAVTGTTTTIALAPWADAGHSLPVDAAFFANRALDTSVNGTAAPAMPAGANQARFFTFATVGVSGAPQLVVIPYGCRLQVVKGTAVSGEAFHVTITVTRMDGNGLGGVPVS